MSRYGTKRVDLGWGTTAPTSGPSSPRWECQPVPGFDVRGADAASDERRACRVECRIEAVGPAGTELQDRTSGGCRHDACRFAGDERLKIEDGEQRGFDELGLRRSRRDAQHGFTSKRRLSFTHGPHIALESKRRQHLVEECLAGRGETRDSPGGRRSPPV